MTQGSLPAHFRWDAEAVAIGERYGIRIVELVRSEAGKLP